MGGYFICARMERLARLLIIQNRNYPISMVCKSFNNRGPGYGDKAVVIRCAREDQTSITLKFYYLENGSARLGFWIRGREFLLPVGIILKGGCLHGKFVDATPFSRSNSNKEDEDNSPVIDELGQMLIAYGFNYYGEEAMYSGIYGRVLRFKIFIGPVYYQRLRHMVSDKFQIRSTGTVDQITRQPIGGRKRGGGIRFGEMERDAVLAHGAAYLLHDWLHTCSDYHIAHSSRGHYCTTPEEKSPTCQISQELYMPSLQNRRRNGNCGDASRVHVFGIRTCSDEHKNEGSVE